MLNKLDPTTIFFLSIVSMFLCSVVMVFVWYVNRNITGALTWLATMLVFTLSTVMFFLRGILGDSTHPAVIFLANELLFIGFLFLLFGCAQFLGYSRQVGLVCIGLFVVTTPFILDALYLNLTFVYSVIVMSLVQLLVLPINLGLLMLGYFQAKVGERCFVGTVLLCITIASILPKSIYQLYLVFVSDAQNSLFQASALNSITSILTLLLPVLLTLSLSILCNERRENQLRKLHQEAWEHVALRSRFLATMSHEIRTPLNGIMGTAQLILASSTEEKTLRDSQTIVKSAELLSDLANNVLEYSRLDMQDLPLEESDFSLRDSLEDVRLLLRPLANNKSLSLTLSISDDIASFYVFDHKKLRQVLINLMGNAIKFTEQGGIRVEVNLLQTLAKDNIATDQLLFSVQDTGIGIPEQAFEHLLQPFYQARNTVNQISGSGLGLAISQKLLNTLNSELQFSSQLAVGSRFYFQLELAQGEEELAELSESVHTSDVAYGLSVLLVEDLPLNQEIAIALLALDKHQVALAVNIAEAAMLCKLQKFDFILSDINLPDGTGMDFAMTIRATVTPNTATPIAAMTARVSAQDAELYRQHGMQYLIAKPVKLSQLRAVLAVSQKQGVDNGTLMSSGVNGASVQLFNKGIMSDLSVLISKEQYQDIQHKLPIQLETQFTKIRDSAARNDIRGLHGALHRAAGTAAQLGFEALAKKLMHLESETEIQTLKPALVEIYKLKQQSLTLFEQASAL